MNVRWVGASLLLVALSLSACKSPSDAPPPPPPANTPPPVPPVSKAPPPSAIPRAEFNRLAVHLNLPIYWIADANGDGGIQPSELAKLLFYPDSASTEWVRDGKFTPQFESAYAKLLVQPGIEQAAARTGAAPADEQARRALVLMDLDQGQPTLVLTKLSDRPGDREFLAAMLVVAEKIDALFEQQSGVTALVGKLPPEDAASASLFRRNRGPQCAGPRTEKDAKCSALPGLDKPLVTVYPARLQTDKKFCAKLEARADATQLLSPFTVVREAGKGKLVAVPYPEAWPQEMQAVQAALRAAIKVLPSGEGPLAAYLEAAAAAFTTNDWAAADEAWAKLDARASRFYVRVGPDETYWEPCAQKAGFHLSFAYINGASLAWQEKLVPVQQEMEAHLAAAAGAPYAAREVKFSLPDFIDIIYNAGDSRGPLGATIGQSLPNWGKVADESRGRTVAMSNLYTDPDSQEVRKGQAASLLDAESLATYAAADPEPGLVSTILHEAAHNLGPSHDYRAGGKTDAEAFGGQLASMLEELKAQTAGLVLVEFLRKKGIINDEFARKVYVDCVIWALGHISSGMTTATGERKAYSQLAAIQVGWLMDQKALVWDAAAKAANGTDLGAFHIDFAKLAPAIDTLGVEVLGIKARADKPRALELTARYVDGEVVPMAVIVERWLRAPKMSFVYAVSP